MIPKEVRPQLYKYRTLLHDDSSKREKPVIMTRKPDVAKSVHCVVVKAFSSQAHRDAYPDSQREGQSIRRKLSNLYRQKFQLAIQYVPGKILYKANGGDGHEQYDMSQGYEENTFLSIEEEDLFGEDDDGFPLLPPLGQPTQQPTQEPTQEPSTQGEDLPGVSMSMTSSPAKRLYRSHVSDRVSRQEFMNKELMSFLEKQVDMNRKELKKHAEMNREERQAVVTTISKCKQKEQT
eukprot:jgi/Psemu1/27874/gm1.27874_g